MSARSWHTRAPEVGWIPRRALSRLGGHPASLERLADILGRSEEDTVALLRENTTARIEDGFVHWDDPYPGDEIRRTLYIGDRAVHMKSGCAPDLFPFAAVLDVPFRAEDTCAATGAPIRVDFVPDGYTRVDPPETVTALVPLGRLREATGATFEQINTSVCNYQPFFASAEAAKGWLTDHPDGRIFTVEEMFPRPWLIHYRDRTAPPDPSYDRAGGGWRALSGHSHHGARLLRDRLRNDTDDDFS